MCCLFYGTGKTIIVEYIIAVNHFMDILAILNAKVTSKYIVYYVARSQDIFKTPQGLKNQEK